MLNITAKGGVAVTGRRSKKEEAFNKIASAVKIILRLVFLVGVGFVMLYPVLFIISGAFKHRIDVYDPTVIWIPKHFSLESLKLALKALKFSSSIKQTLLILIPSVILQMISTTMAGYGFARFKFKERGILFGGLIFTIIVPIQNLIVPLYADFQSFDMFGIGYLIGAITGNGPPSLLNTGWPFYLMAFFGMGIRSGLYIFIIRQFFRNMPKELEEAAMIDGCSGFKTFTKVMLPNVKPALLTVFVFSVVWYWNDFYQASMFLLDKRTLSVSLTMLSDQLDIAAKAMNVADTDLALMRDGVLECGCLLVMLPLLVFYIILQKQFTEGVERTGIVG